MNKAKPPVVPRLPNPKAKDLLARLARDDGKSFVRKANPGMPVKQRVAERKAIRDKLTAALRRVGKFTVRTKVDHAAKMALKADRRDPFHAARNTPTALARLHRLASGSIAMNSHEHKREIARRLRQTKGN